MKAVAAAFIVVAALLARPAGAGAQDPNETEMREIAAELACPVCQGQSVRDSNAPLAGQIRELILEKLRAGEDAQSIKQFVVDRYGEGILMEPPKRGLTLGIWIVPLVFVALGLAVVAFRVLRIEAVPTSPLEPADLEQKLEAELARRRRRP